MSVSISQLLTMPNDSIGSEKWSASPYFIDLVTLAIISSAIVSRSEGMIRVGAFVIAACLAIWAALAAKRLRHYILDTPRSKIASAAQGFVELQGKCEFHGNRETQGFLHGPPCVWHRYSTVDLRTKKEQSGQSDLPFVIRDESGRCIVNPVGAKIISSSKRTWTEGGKVYRSKYIRYGASMYIIGELRADGCPVTSYNERAEVSGLLSTWKQDQPWLLEEFDSDNNGNLDPEEWEGAVKRAKTVAQNIFNDKRVGQAENTIRKPSNGLPMLISDRHPDELAKQFSWLGYFNFFVAGGCIVYAFYLLTR